MSEKKYINNEYLKNLVKETISSQSSEKNKKKSENSIPLGTKSQQNSLASLEEKDVDIELQIFVDSLLAGKQKAALSSLDRLLTTGSDLESIYFAAVDRMYDLYFSNDMISEQEIDQDEEGMEILRQKFGSGESKAAQLDKSLEVMKILANSLREQGKTGDADEVDNLIKDLEKDKKRGEVELALAIIAHSEFRLSPDRLETSLIKDIPQVQQAGMANPLALIVRGLGYIFSRGGGRVLQQGARGAGRKGSRTITRRANNAKARSDRLKGRRFGKNKEKNARRQRKSKDRSKSNRTKKNQQPQPPKPPPRRVGRFKQLGIILGVAFLDELLGPLSAIIDDIGKLATYIQLESAYSGSHLQYALENFEGEETETLEYKEVSMFFALFSRVDYESSNCIPDNPVISQDNIDKKDLCSNITMNPDLYTLSIDLQQNLSSELNYPENIFRAYKKSYQNKGGYMLDIQAYYNIYLKYKKLFKDSQITSYVTDELVFINKEQAKAFARAAAKKKIDPSQYIAYCIKPILLQELDNQATLDLTTTSSWEELLDPNTEILEPVDNFINKLKDYKDNFVDEYFDDLTMSEVNPQEQSKIKNIRLHFSSLATSTQTHMIKEKGGYDAIIKCIRDTNKKANDDPIEYALQAEKVKMFIAIFGGAYLDGKMLQLFSFFVKKAKNKFLPKPGVEDFTRSPWATFLKFWPLIEMTFYFTDPTNRVERVFMRNRFDEIKEIIDQEILFFEAQGQNQWKMRPEQTKKVQQKINLIFDEIYEELNTSIDRFYDMVKTEESLCQQLEDKKNMRIQTRDLTLRFRQAVTYGFQKDLQDKEKLDTAKAQDLSLGSLIINYENAQTISDTIPLLKEEITELHKQVAVPEVGLFLQADINTPEQVIKILKDPLAAKRAAEAEASRSEETEGERLLRRYKNKRVPNWHPLREQRKQKIGSNILLYLKNLSDTKDFNNVPKLMNNLNDLLYDQKEKKFLSLIADKYKILSFEQAGEPLIERINNLKSLSAREKLPGEPVSKNITPVGSSKYDKSDVEIKEIIKKGYKEFKLAITSESDYYKKLPSIDKKIIINKKGEEEEVANTPTGCVIRFPPLEYRHGGLWSSVESPFGGFIISNPTRGVSLAHNNITGYPYFQFFKQFENIANYGMTHEKSMKQIYDLVSNPIKAYEEYKVIYHPDYVEIDDDGGSCGDSMLNMSSANGQPDVVDIVVNNRLDTNSLGAVSFADFERGIIPAVLDTTLKFDTSKQQQQVKDIIKKTTDYKIKLLRLKQNNTRLQSVITAQGQGDDLINNNIMIATVIINVCRAFIATCAVHLSAKEYALPAVRGQIKNIHEKYIEANKDSNKLQKIVDLANQIQPLYYARPAGTGVTIYGSDRDSLNRALPEKDPMRRAQIDADNARRCMHKTGVYDIIESNWDKWTLMHNEIVTLKKRKNIISNNLEQDYQSIGKLIRNMYILYYHNVIMSENMFDLNGIIMDSTSN